MDSNQDTLIESYERDGVVLLKNLLDQTMLDELACGVDYNRSHPTSRQLDYRNDSETGERFFFDAMLVDENPYYKSVVFSSLVAETVARFMRSDTAVASNITVFFRSAGAKKRTPWHRDQPYWPVDGWQCCSTWFPLDPVTSQTALEFVSESHRWKDIYVREDFSDTVEQSYLAEGNTVRQPFPDIQSNRDNYNILAWDMQPGDCLLFHGMTAHGGSGDLPSDLGRRAISIQWFGDDITFAPKPGGADPDFLDEIRAAGVEPGDPMASGVCPLVWANKERCPDE